MIQHQDYYIYCHYEADTGRPFYVGKGRANRMGTSSGRNRYWRSVVKKHGLTCAKVAEGMANELANFAEMEKIDQLRKLGFRLTNLTDGGDGLAGYSHSADAKEKIAKNSWNKTNEGKESIKARWTKEKRSAHAEITKMHFAHEERRFKQSIALKNYFDTPGAREKVGDRARKFYSDNPEAREIARLKTLAVRSDPKKNAKMIAAMKDPDVRMRMSDAARNRPIMECPHCGIKGAAQQLKRWHFEKCKNATLVQNLHNQS